MTELMLFPLSTVVLPEGKMRLRIFEPRYKRLVKQASLGDGTFAICLFERDESNQVGGLSTSGSQVKIVDFETLEDGLLGITVVGIRRLSIRRMRVEPDGLRFAKVDWLPSWDVSSLSDENNYISEQLQRVYAKFPQVGQLYDQCFFDDASWVTQRWLELLPVNMAQFDYLMRQPDCREALHFLTSAIEPE
ncbi:LON peptidase substrate-binding domain-containing protein [Vibrio taketomensis]|uniref:LON peptidase substrate-binding domain-containing protein n=1 Tax=Vibrio taketomensis TaxID=2572923 RepID=UPI00138A419D|nr:LON peptidase substrate-binding domain-containing protein [Vibrio taketomensis]